VPQAPPQDVPQASPGQDGDQQPLPPMNDTQ